MLHYRRAAKTAPIAAPAAEGSMGSMGSMGSRVAADLANSRGAQARYITENVESWTSFRYWPPSYLCICICIAEATRPQDRYCRPESVESRTFRILPPT